MPLLGTHKHDTHATADGTHHNETLPPNDNYAGVGAHTGTGTGAGAGMGMHNDTYPAAGHTTTGTGVDPRYNNPAGAGTTKGSTYGHHGAAVGTAAVGPGVQDQYGVTAAPNNEPSMPHTGAVNHPNQNRGGTGHSTTGKIEHALGSLVGSSALKAKGLQKQQEANSMKLQGQEIAKAEALEQEAAMRRERAVTHGAHPDNQHLGGRSGLGPAGGGTFT